MPKFRCVRDILEYAVAKEHQAHDFYMALARRVQDTERRATLLHLAQEEAQHKLKLEIEYDWITF